MTGVGARLFHALAVLVLALAPMPLAAQMVPQPTPDADALAAAVRRLGPNPRDLDALITAGELSLKLGDVSAAAALLKRAEGIDPMNGRVKAGMARILVQEERPGEALRFFDQALGYGLDPRTFAGDRGLAYDLIGEQERAQRDYRLALKAGPNEEVIRRYALSLGISGKRDAALEQIDSLLRKSDRGAWRGRAFILAMTGDVPGATDIATRMMPGPIASGLQPFFVMLPKLSPVDRAFAVHFGEVRATPQRLADARLAPALPVLAPEPGVAVAAAKPALRVPEVESSRDRRARRAAERGRSRQRREPVRVAVAQAAPAVAPLPPPPTLPRGPVFAPPAEVVQSVPVQVAAAPVVPRPAPAVTQPIEIARAPTRRGPMARIYGPPVAVSPATPPVTPVPTPAPAPLASVPSTPVQPASAQPAPVQAAPVQSAPATVAPASPVAVAATNLGAGFSSIETGAAVPSVTAAVSAPTPPVSSSVSVAVAPPSPVPSSTGPSVSAAVAPAPTPLPPPTNAAVVAAAAAPPAPATTPRAASPARADTILAQIMAGISIPAEELGVAPVRAVPEPTPAPAPAPAPVVAAAPAPPKVEAKPPLPPVAKTKPVPAKPAPAETRAAERKALAEKKALADKKLADAKKAAEAKALAEEKKLAKADPPRIWVQVSGGANESDLPKAWSAVKGKAAALNGRPAYSTPLRATNRVVTGPFKTDAEARAFVNQLAKQGVSAFPFTSAKGQKMKPLSK